MGDHAEDAINEEIADDYFDPDAKYCEFRGWDCPRPSKCLSGCAAEEADYLDPDFMDEDDE